MAFEWRSFIAVANRLLTLGEAERDTSVQEALLRSAVSRAYYAAYHESVRFAKQRLGFVPAKQAAAGSHLEVVEFLQKHPDLSRIGDLGDRLDLIRIARKQADYIEREPSKFMVLWANEHVASAESILEDMGRL